MSVPSTPSTAVGSQHTEMLSSQPEPPSQGARSDWDLGTLALAGLLVSLLAALGLALLWMYGSTQIMAGVETAGISLGGSSRRAASALLQQAWSEKVVVLQADDGSWSVLVSDLGLVLDVEATIDVALNAGSPSGRLHALWGDVEPQRVSPVVSVDRSAARRTLEGLSPQLAVAPIDADIRVAQGRAEAVTSVPGRALDVEATVERLAAHGARIAQDGRLALVLRSVPAAIVDLEALVERADAWLSNPLAIRAYDPIANESLWWTAAPEVWGDGIALHVDPVHPEELDWSLDLSAVRGYLDGRAQALAPARYVDVGGAVQAVESALSAGEWQVAIRVYHHPSQHVVQPGETLSSIARAYGFPYPWLQEANPGVEALSPNQVIQIPSPDVLLPLPVVMHKRIVVSISQQRMWAYEWEELVWAWTVSTGIDSSPTSPGVFQVQSHHPNAYAASWDLWMPYFVGIYRPVPTASFENGFHGFPTRDGQNLLWTGNLGYPVTYGCILLSTENAALLYEWAEAGVVVEVRP